ncbi:Hermansky-Pudlak syndrome 5 protein-like isoform X1 [Huso huso]|uniref:Hermansky-Pudlak syndrome 5 protein homolog n=1 Tax=Huso huso TaxID=61971 RepID=A0ABR0YJW8_HUSHU
MPSVPVIPESYSHVLAECDSLDPLLSALRLDSSRLKCTCVAVSRKWLALGSSPGGLHLIQKEGWKQRLILTHKEGAVCRVACCPHDEDFVAVATSQGVVVVWDLHLDSRGKPERVCVSTEHRDRAVTALCWDSTQHRLFVGDAVGRVSTVRASSSKQGKGASFVMFPVQTVTTVDSRVVQLSYLEGRLLVSSLTRCYLCDTDREKFWRIGNKERDGEYGACFFPAVRNPGSSQALIYCARPGSRMWEVNFEGKVLSTHQFKQLLASPPLPLITHRSEPLYGTSPCSPQSISFPRLLFLSDQYVLTWTERGIYIFLPQSVQVLLWSEIKDVQDVAVYRNELFCLHGDGHLSHLSLLPVERCVERLLRRESWGLAATVCCLFQHAVSPSRARKSLPIDRLEHLKGQLDGSTQHELIGQLEEVISKLEPFDSASSSRRSSISSSESFNVLDCGIYRVISRRGSQSDEDASSLVSQTLSEDERLREFSSTQEEEPPAEHGHPAPPSVRVEADRIDPLLQFHIPLSFRPTPPRVALQAVKDSVSSFMRKTTEKINTLQMPSDLWPKPDGKEGGGQPCEAVVTVVTYPEEQEQEVCTDRPPAEEDELRGLKEATARAVAQLQDPLVLLNTDSLLEVLRTWLPALERAWGLPEDCAERGGDVQSPVRHWGDSACDPQKHAVQRGEDSPAAAAEGATGLSEEPEDSREPGDQIEEAGCPNHGGATDHPAALPTSPQEHSGVFEDPGTDRGETRLEGEGSRWCTPAPPVLMRVTPPCELPLELHRDLTELATLCLELGCFHGDGATPCHFLHRFFFLLDLERARRSCLMRYRDCPAVWGVYTAGLRELTRSSPGTVVLEEGDLLKSLRYLRAQEPWDAALLLAHLSRLYERHGELALRSFGQFYPTIIPADVMALSRRSPAHFLAYLDNLVKWKPAEQRLSLIGSLLQPESLRQDWLELALSHDAPQPVDTISPEGNPRSRSHLFSWGYGQLLSLLLKLPGNLQCKEKMAETCRSHGFWTGYLYLCWQLERRTEAFLVIVSLDDMGLLEGPNGVMPETLEEWKYLLQTTQSKADEPASPCSPHGNGLANVGSDWSSHVSLENVTLLLARTVGPDRALAVLQECGLSVELSERSALVCEILRIAEKRQRALIQAMLEKCDRFLWSQQA